MITTMIPNHYLIAGAIAATVLVGWKIHAMGYTAGANDVAVAYAEALADAKEKEKKDVIEVIKWKEKKVIEYRDRVQTIKVAADPTGCLDTGLADVGLSGMLRTDSDPSRSSDDDAD
jgi:hypothetical protein